MIQIDVLQTVQMVQVSTIYSNREEESLGGGGARVYVLESMPYDVSCLLFRVREECICQLHGHTPWTRGCADVAWQWPTAGTAATIGATVWVSLWRSTVTL